jgi:hypothetical protein
MTQLDAAYIAIWEIAEDDKRAIRGVQKRCPALQSFRKKAAMDASPLVTVRLDVSATTTVRTGL